MKNHTSEFLSEFLAELKEKSAENLARILPTESLFDLDEMANSPLFQDYIVDILENNYDLYVESNFVFMETVRSYLKLEVGLSEADLDITYKQIRRYATCQRKDNPW